MVSGTSWQGTNRLTVQYIKRKQRERLCASTDKICST